MLRTPPLVQGPAWKYRGTSTSMSKGLVHQRSVPRETDSPKLSELHSAKRLKIGSNRSGRKHPLRLTKATHNNDDLGRHPAKHLSTKSARRNCGGYQQVHAKQPGWRGTDSGAQRPRPHQSCWRLQNKGTDISAVRLIPQNRKALRGHLGRDSLGSDRLGRFNTAGRHGPGRLPIDTTGTTGI